MTDQQRSDLSFLYVLGVVVAVAGAIVTAWMEMWAPVVTGIAGGFLIMIVASAIEDRIKRKSGG